MPLSWLSSSYRILEDDNQWVEFSHTTIGVVMDYTFPVPPAEDESSHADIQRINASQSEDISEVVERYFSNFSPATVKSYKADMKTWWMHSHKNPDQTTENDILKYVKHMEQKGYSNATINRKLASLSKVFSIYIRLGLMRSNPIQTLSATTKLYKPVETRVTEVITRHDIEAVVSNAQRRTAVIVKFLGNTGLRINEALSITKSDLEAYSPEYMRIKVTGKRSKIRFIFCPYTLYQEIKDTFDSDSIYLFASKSGQKLSRTNVYRQVNTAFKKYAHKSGVGNHSLRHFFATQKIVHEKKDFKAVSQYLGHKSIKTTLDIYSHSQLTAEETQII
jgi:integrase/recombinase XerC